MCFKTCSWKHNSETPVSDSSRRTVPGTYSRGIACRVCHVYRGLVGDQGPDPFTDAAPVRTTQAAMGVIMEKAEGGSGWSRIRVRRSWRPAIRNGNIQAAGGYFDG